MAEILPVGSDIDNAYVTPNPTTGRVSLKSYMANPQDQFGGAAAPAVMQASGDISLQVASAGINPGATGADNVLAVFTIPAGSFDQAGRGVWISASGSFGATVNNKTVKIIFNPATAVVGSTVGAGGSTIASTGVVTQNGGGWALEGTVFKYGAAGSNTQIGLHGLAQVSTVVAPVAPSLITANEANPILVAITGNAATATTDIVFNCLQVVGFN